MIRKIPAQPFPFFNTVIRPAWRVMNMLIFLIAFFSPWFSSYQILFDEHSVNCTAPSCRLITDTVTIPAVATVKDSSKPVGVTVKSSNNVPYAGTEVYACNGQRIYTKMTDAKGQATFTLPQGSYRFRARLYDAQYCSNPEPHGKTYNGFAAVGFLWTEGLEVESISLLLIIGLLCGVYSLVSAGAVFAKQARYIAFIPLAIGAAGVMMFTISFRQSAPDGWGRFLYDGSWSTWIAAGYLFTWMGLVSSAVVEFIEWVLIWDFNKDMAAKIISLAFTSFFGVILSLAALFVSLRVIEPLASLVGKVFDNGSWFGGVAQALLFDFIAHITIIIALYTFVGISFSFIYRSIQTDGSRLNKAETILYSALSSSGSYLLVMLFFFLNLFSASFNANTRISSGGGLSWLILGVLIGLLCATLLGAAGGRLTVKWRTKVQEA